MQARQLRSVHEDGHHCSVLFKMQQTMAVSIRHHSSFVCLDNKAKIPVGEPALPMSMGVRARPNIMLGKNKAMALDHDQNSGGSLTPSVIFKCNILSETARLFYKGQLNVIIKDTVL